MMLFLETGFFIYPSRGEWKNPKKLELEFTQQSLVIVFFG